MVDQPGEQDVDRVRVDRAASPRLVRTAVDRALLDLEVAVVGDRLGDVEQQKIVEEDVQPRRSTRSQAILAIRYPLS